MGKPRSDFPTMPPAGQGKEFGSYVKLMKSFLMIDLKIDQAKASTPAFDSMVALEARGAQLKASISRDIDNNHLLTASGYAGGGVQALGSSRDTVAYQAQMTQRVEPLKADSSQLTQQQKDLLNLVVNLLSRLHDKFSDIAEKLGGNVREEFKDLMKIKKEYTELTSQKGKLDINISALQSKLDSVNAQLDALLPARKTAREEKPGVAPTLPKLGG